MSSESQPLPVLSPADFDFIGDLLDLLRRVSTGTLSPKDLDNEAARIRLKIGRIRSVLSESVFLDNTDSLQEQAQKIEHLHTVIQKKRVLLNGIAGLAREVVSRTDALSGIDLQQKWSLVSPAKSEEQEDSITNQVAEDGDEDAKLDVDTTLMSIQDDPKLAVLHNQSIEIDVQSLATPNQFDLQESFRQGLQTLSEGQMESTPNWEGQLDDIQQVMDHMADKELTEGKTNAGLMQYMKDAGLPDDNDAVMDEDSQIDQDVADVVRNMMNNIESNADVGDLIAPGQSTDDVEPDLLQIGDGEEDFLPMDLE
ncbi:uncharacterized protein V1518DRAFT_416174 [Limtongia smithiae]|uniref:uncharacterized protein n=1 Tax=Limtongia smithiae TaxID=1125753 RepID=UPI0034CE17E7